MKFFENYFNGCFSNTYRCGSPLDFFNSYILNSLLTVDSGFCFVFVIPVVFGVMQPNFCVSAVVNLA